MNKLLVTMALAVSFMKRFFGLFGLNEVEGRLGRGARVMAAVAAVSLGLLSTGCSGNQSGDSQNEDVAEVCEEGCSQGEGDKAERGVVESEVTKKYYFKATKTERELYGEFEYRLHWPMGVDDYDVAKLQKCIMNRIHTGIKADNLADFIQQLNANHYDPSLWMTVQKRGTSEDDMDAEDDGYPPFETEGYVDLKLDSYDREKGMVCYEVMSYFHPGCGLGACDIERWNFVYFDLKQNKEITFKDVFKPTAKRIILNNLLSAPVEYRPVNAYLEQPSRVPERWFVKDGVVYFIYDKYEVGCGADGEVALGVQLEDLRQVMTEYGKGML